MLADNHLSLEHEACIAACQGGPVHFDGANGKYVVMRIEVYDAMFGIVDDSLAATIAAVQEGLADVAAGRTQDADEFFKTLQ